MHSCSPITKKKLRHLEIEKDMLKSNSTSKILCCLTPNHNQVQSTLLDSGFKFNLIAKEKDKYKAYNFDRKNVFGFNKIDDMLYFIDFIKTPPILWESIKVVRELSLNINIIFLDSELKTDGIILFKKLDEITLIKHARIRFRSDQELMYNSEHQNFSDDSVFSIMLNNFLNSFPDYVHLPFLIALASSMENQNYETLNTFIEMNRLLTDKNKKIFKQLNKELSKTNPIIKMFLDGNKKEIKDQPKNLRNNLNRVVFIINHFGTRDLTTFTDDEDNINAHSMKV